ncbi:MAG: hypothetical protein ACREGR_01900 [Minisyncoccia bacterium]
METIKVGVSVAIGFLTAAAEIHFLHAQLDMLIGSAAGAIMMGFFMAAIRKW